MWSRTASGERRVRAAVGALGLVVLLAGLVFVPAQANPFHHLYALAGALFQKLQGQPESLLVTVDDAHARAAMGDPRSLLGTVVYEEGPLGEGLIIGRLEPGASADALFRLRLPPERLARYRDGATLFLLPPARDLAYGLDLVLWPDNLATEAARFHAALRPALETHLFPRLEAGVRAALVRFAEELAADQDEPTVALRQGTLAGLFDIVKAEAGPFAGRLAVRALTSVGPWNLLKCIGNKGWQAAENIGRFLGGLFRDETTEYATYLCLDEEGRERLDADLKDEVARYWEERGPEIRARVGAVLADYEAPFVERVKERLVPAMLDIGREAWSAARGDVAAAVAAYTEDLAARRLFTRDGGPRLHAAYLIRCLAGITRRPLLVIAAVEVGAVPGTAALRLHPLAVAGMEGAP